ncbi:MAG: hypothetical protein AAFO28_01455, partial [Pseudomonadota bacterium]
RLACVSALAVALSACASGSVEEEPYVTSAPPPMQEPMAMPPPAPPPIYRVRSGSPSVLERFARGSVVTQETQICLEDGEQINIVGNNGQSVTYVGPGCMTRTAPASSDNEGGFIFGLDTAQPARSRALLTP